MFPGCYTINDKSILIFGGKNSKNLSIKQSFIINFTLESKDNIVGNIIEINKKMLPIKGFMMDNTVIYEKNLYSIISTSDIDKKLIIFDGKSFRY